ncbi:MAG: methyltransferase domain-containing protein [Desulfobacteraceae bacterium]|jgi:demethylmenaquinone methyltransferase/2-methoxy-6-polyprenyl-1,4-benzoquinol methylase
MGNTAQKLALSDLLRAPVIQGAIRTLDLPPGSRGLDVGCGIGSHTLLLAEAVGEGGHVTGLDRSRELLAEAEQRAGGSSQRNRVSFQYGDMYALPWPEDSMDWVWSVDCAGYAPGDPVLLLREFARVVRPGGRIVLLAWSSQQLLPGHPVLEARLNASSQGIAPFAQGQRPESHVMRALGWFEEAGLKDARARTLVGDVQAPLGREVREALLSLFDMRWGDPGVELSAEDEAEYRRLCVPESPDCILNVRDYYAFFTYSLFEGSVGIDKAS